MISTVLELKIRIYLYYNLWRPVNKNKIWKESMHPRSPLGQGKLAVENNLHIHNACNCSNCMQYTTISVLIFVWSIILMSVVWCWSFSIMKPVFIYEAVYCDEVFAVIQAYLYNNDRNLILFQNMHITPTTSQIMRCAILWWFFWALNKNLAYQSQWIPVQDSWF